jgi:hypothetical protein
MEPGESTEGDRLTDCEAVDWVRLELGRLFPSQLIPDAQSR